MKTSIPLYRKVIDCPVVGHKFDGCTIQQYRPLVLGKLHLCIRRLLGRYPRNMGGFYEDLHFCGTADKPARWPMHHLPHGFDRNTNS